MKTGKKITKEQAIALGNSGFWRDMTKRQIAEFQMHVELMCMPFGVFHEALEETLGRPVFTHEMGMNWEGLKAELGGERQAPSLEEILDLIPEDKRLIVVSE